MAQHDYVIDNSTGANVRADINNALQAIATNNSGSSDPSTTYAFQLFADTTNNVMKIRNAANNAFIELFQLDGTFTLEDGSASTPALAFRDDLNTGIFSGGADEFNITTGGTERLVINSSGNVGIGTTSPQSLLEVNGANNAVVGISLGLALPSLTASRYIGITQSGNATNLATNSGFQGIEFGAPGSTNEGYLAFHTHDNGVSSGERMRIDKSGNVGIGTSSPAAQLEVKNTGNVKIYADASGGYIQQSVSNLDKLHLISSGEIKYQSDPENDSSNTSHIFECDGSEKLRIDSSGRVGIGTTSPVDPLHVSSDGGVHCRIESTTSGSARLALKAPDSTYSGLHFGDGADLDVGRIRYYHTSDFMQFSTNASESMRIDSAGRVGIGTTSPTVNVQVQSSGTNSLLKLAGTSAGSGINDGLDVGINGVNGILWNRENGNIQFATNNSERMRIDSSTIGRLLIGTTSSSNTDNSLEVRNANAGAALGITSSSDSNQQDFITFKVGSGNTANGSISRDGLTNGVAFFSGSDRRIKTNIENMDNVLDKINQLSLKKFDFKQGGSGVGLIAQDLINIFPNKVKKDASDDGTGDTVPDGVEPWTIGHNFTYEILKAIQELTARVEALETA